MFLHTGLGVQLKRKSTYPVFWVTWIRQCHPGRRLLIAVPAFGIPPKKHAEVSFVIFARWARTACWVPFSHHSHSSHPNHLQYQLQTQCRQRPHSFHWDSNTLSRVPSPNHSHSSHSNRSITFKLFTFVLYSDLSMFMRW